MTKVPGKTCLRWIITGGSYPGALAGWIMQQHPNLFAASISSSGVVDARFNIPEFDIHTRAAAGLPCGNFINQALREIEYVTENLNDDYYLNMFNASRTKLADFYYFLADVSLMIMQYSSWKATCENNFNNAWRNGSNVT